MNAKYYLGQIARYYGDPRISDVNRQVLDRFDRELTAGVKLAIRCAYALTLSIAVLLSGQRFEEVDKVLLRFFKGLRDRLKEVSYNLIHSNLKRFLSGCI